MTYGYWANANLCSTAVSKIKAEILSNSKI